MLLPKQRLTTNAKIWFIKYISILNREVNWDHTNKTFKNIGVSSWLSSPRPPAVPFQRAASQSSSWSKTPYHFTYSDSIFIFLSSTIPPLGALATGLVYMCAQLPLHNYGCTHEEKLTSSCNHLIYEGRNCCIGGIPVHSLDLEQSSCLGGGWGVQSNFHVKPTCCWGFIEPG